MSGIFDGPSGWAAAKVMEVMNAEAEAEAIERLGPKADGRYLVIGFGPGIGLQLLHHKVPDALIVGIDPSNVMVRRASKRNKAAIETGIMRLLPYSLEDFVYEETRFDAGIAVNSLQLCEPIELASQRLAQLTSSCGRLISLTHGWAMERHAGSISEFVAHTTSALENAGFMHVRSGTAKSEGGKSVFIEAAKKAQDIDCE